MKKLRIRHAISQDTYSILRMPPYLKSKCEFPCSEEEVFVAVRDERILGAVTVGYKHFSFVQGDWRDDFEQQLGSLIKKVSGSWISKLYVFPEFRKQGIGTKLVEASLRSLEQGNVAEVYAGINVKNEFREVSTRIFEAQGFNRVGSCICPLAKGYCRGTLFRKNLFPKNKRR